MPHPPQCSPTVPDRFAVSDEIRVRIQSYLSIVDRLLHLHNRFGIHRDRRGKRSGIEVDLILTLQSRVEDQRQPEQLTEGRKFAELATGRFEQLVAGRQADILRTEQRPHTLQIDLLLRLQGNDSETLLARALETDQDCFGLLFVPRTQNGVVLVRRPCRFVGQYPVLRTMTVEVVFYSRTNGTYRKSPFLD